MGGTLVMALLWKCTCPEGANVHPDHDASCSVCLTVSPYPVPAAGLYPVTFERLP